MTRGRVGRGDPADLRPRRVPWWLGAESRRSRLGAGGFAERRPVGRPPRKEHRIADVEVGAVVDATVQRLPRMGRFSSSRMVASGSSTSPRSTGTTCDRWRITCTWGTWSRPRSSPSRRTARSICRSRPSRTRRRLPTARPRPRVRAEAEALHAPVRRASGRLPASHRQQATIASQADRRAVAAQLGREPFVPFEVVARCGTGHPMVIRNHPTDAWPALPHPVLADLSRLVEGRGPARVHRAGSSASSSGSKPIPTSGRAGGGDRRLGSVSGAAQAVDPPAHLAGHGLRPVGTGQPVQGGQVAVEVIVGLSRMTIGWPVPHLSSTSRGRTATPELGGHDGIGLRSDPGRYPWSPEVDNTSSDCACRLQLLLELGVAASLRRELGAGPAGLIDRSISPSSFTATPGLDLVPHVQVILHRTNVVSVHLGDRTSPRRTSRAGETPHRGQ